MKLEKTLKAIEKRTEKKNQLITGIE